MPNVGIVGHEAKKFTPATEAIARAIIRRLLEPRDAVLVSGGCHLGGIDIWAEEEADALGRGKQIFRPARLTWGGGYKVRNENIARVSHIVHSIVVERLPSTYDGLRFEKGCYHCLERNPPHVKSGGCWTAWKCAARAFHIIKDPDK